MNCLAGDVKFAEIVMDKGRSTGVGYVRFANYEDAHRAISILFYSSETFEATLHVFCSNCFDFEFRFIFLILYITEVALNPIFQIKNIAQDSISETLMLLYTEIEPLSE